MRNLSYLAAVVIALTFISTPDVHATDITGAGSTFVYPVLAKWADSYKKQTGVAVNYQSIGSGGGIKQVEAKTVDFGATDMPLKPEELKAKNLVQFPIINGADVVVVHIDVPAGQLKLSGAVIANIFMGKIKKWNDPQITQLNAGLKLPDQDINVVHRSDGSGTTFIFSNYLSKVSAEWKSQVGEGTAVKWPVGIGGKGNEGMASYVKQLPGAIGYVEYAYAVQNKMIYTQIQNKAGKFVEPTPESFAAAAAGVDWNKSPTYPDSHEPSYDLIMTDASGPKAWPIAGSTFILMQKDQPKPEQAEATLKFFAWAYKNGGSAAKELFYVPLPAKATNQIRHGWSKTLNGVDVKSL